MPTRPQQHRPSHVGQGHRDQARNQQPYRKLLWTQRFRRFRDWFILNNPLCNRCPPETKRPTVHVHHKRKLAQHPEDLCDQGQCEGLCHECHSKATAQGE